jgi:uncharacterized protein
MDPYAAPPPMHEQKLPPGPMSKDVLTMAMLCHLLGGLLGILGALIMWLVKKDDHPFIDDQGKESVNFQLANLIAQLVGMVVVVASCGFLFFIPIIIYVGQLVYAIIAAMKANEGQWYRYPVTIRFIK